MTDNSPKSSDAPNETTILPMVPGKQALTQPTTPLQGQAGATAPTLGAIPESDLTSGQDPDTTLILPPHKGPNSPDTTLVIDGLNVPTDRDLSPPNFEDTELTQPTSIETAIAPEPPELQKIPNIAGAKVAARAGITKDGEIKELPGVILDVEIWLTSIDGIDSNKEAWKMSKTLTMAYGGDILHFIPTPDGKIRFQAIFENENQAKKAAYKIQERTGRNQPAERAKFGMGEDTVKLATYNGHLLVLGRAAAAAFRLQHANPPLTNSIASHKTGRPPIGQDLKDIEVEEILALHSRITPESEKHATGAIRMPNPDMPKNATRVEIRLPEETANDPEKAYAIGARYIDAIAPHPMEKDAAYTQTHVVFIGDTLTIYLPEERSPGNLGDRLESIQEELINDGLIMFVSQSRYSVIPLDEHNHTFQGVLPAYATKGKEIGVGVYLDEDIVPGIYIDEAFKFEAEHERNLSIARFTTGGEVEYMVGVFGKKGEHGRYAEMQDTETRKLIRVNNIETTEEITISGRETIGREKEVGILRKTIKKVKTSGEAEVTVVEGESGVGKTRHAKDAEKIAEAEGFTSINAKVLEKGKTKSGSGVRRLVHSLFKKLPTSTKDGFRDLELFEKGVVPPGEAGEYEKPVAASNSQPATLAERIKNFIEIAATTVPLQLIMDDLQWLDPYSIEVISQLIAEIPKSTRIHIILLGRSVEDKIPNDILAAAEKRIEHHQSVELKRINDKDKIEGEILENEPEIEEEALATRVETRIFELTKQYIYTNLPEEWDGTPISEGFVQKIATLSQGLPIVITEIISLFLMRGDINKDQSEIKTPTDAEIDKIAGENITETLSTVIQAKFERITDTERAVVDYLVVYGTTDASLFIEILKTLGLEETEIRAAIEGLQIKKVIHGKPVEFTHDLIRSQREIQMETRGELSKKAAECYKAATRYRDQYPHLITPTQLFDLSEEALKNENTLDPETISGLKKDRIKTGREAIAHHIRNQNTLRALEIAEKLASELAKSKDPVQLQILGDIYLQAAESHIRLGHQTEPTEVLEKYKALETTERETTREKELKYKVLKIKAAFAARKPADLMTAVTELQTTLAPLTVDEHPEKYEPHVIIASSELTLARLRLAMLRKDGRALEELEEKAREDITTLKIVARVAKSSGPKETLLLARSLLVDIYRQLNLAKADIFSTSNYGPMGEELTTLRELESVEKAEAAMVETSLGSALNKYKADSELVRDPQTFGYLYVTVAKLQIYQGKSEDAAQTIERGLILSRNWGLPEVTAALYLLAGDTTVADNLEKEPINFNGEKLKTAVRGYSQGITEMSRAGGEKSDIANTSIANRTLATALYAQYIAANNPSFRTYGTDATASLEIPGMKQATETLTELTGMIRTSWDAMIETLRTYREKYYNETYLMELSTAGLLYKAAKDMNIRLEVPGFITEADIAQEKSHLLNLKETYPARSSRIDKKLRDLRLAGINGFSN